MSHFLMITRLSPHHPPAPKLQENKSLRYEGRCWIKSNRGGADAGFLVYFTFFAMSR